MREIISEIMSEEYCEEYREKYSEMMEDLYELLIEFMVWCSDEQYVMGAGHSAAAAPVSLATAGGTLPIQV